MVFTKEQLDSDSAIELKLKDYSKAPPYLPQSSDENLFDSNHFTGYDRIESGPRVNYGLRGRVSDTQHGEVSFLMGQSYHAKENK
jgi:lipopolysaccharide assembly outer membrane protein LptD (OstA)